MQQWRTNAEKARELRKQNWVNMSFKGKVQKVKISCLNYCEVKIGCCQFMHSSIKAAGFKIVWNKIVDKF